jgi:putative PIN family toxin of toxin-antitoxin system
MVARTEIGRRLRVVLDTNVVLSGLLFKAGRVSDVFSCILAEQVIPLVTRETAAELVRVLAYPKFKLAAQEQRLLLETYLQYAEVVESEDARDVPECRDPNDVPFLVAALCGRADYLVTGDRDLLAVKAGHLHCPIISPEQFAEILHG